MNTSTVNSAPAASASCQDRRRAAKAVVMLNRADALARRAGATSGARSARFLREASKIRLVEAEALRLQKAKA